MDITSSNSDDIWFTQKHRLNQRKWGIQQTSKHSNCEVQVANDHLIVQEHENEPGRGAPRHILEPRRILLYAELLQKCSGMKLTDIYGMGSVDTINLGDIRTWKERIPTDVLIGGIEENRKRIINEFISDQADHWLRKSRAVFKYDPDVSFMLCEHLELEPLAYGITGQTGTLLRFTRDVRPSSERFFTVQLNENEPSPCVYDIAPEMLYYHSNNFGMCPMIPQERKSNYYLIVQGTENNFFDEDSPDGELCDGVIYPIKEFYAFGQLEPSRLSPTQEEYHKMAQIFQKEDKSCFYSPGDLCFYRSSLIFEQKIRNIFGPLLRFDLVYLLEAYGTLCRMHEWSHALDVRSHGYVGKPSEVPYNPRRAKITRALKFVIQELEMSPRNLTFLFQHLFREYGTAKSPFPDGAIMRVFGFGSTRPGLMSFLPTLHEKYRKQRTSQDMEKLLLLEFRARSSKKKRSHWNNEKKKTIEKSEADIRRVPVPELDEIIHQLGVAYKTIHQVFGKRRWDKTWYITTVASSSKGKTVLGGSIAKYARDERKTKPHSSLHAKLELVRVQHLIEKQDFFKKFRELAASSWNRLTQNMVKEEAYEEYSPSNKRIKLDEDELNDFANELGASLQVKESEPEDDEEEDEEEDETTVEGCQRIFQRQRERIQAREDYIKWAKKIQSGKQPEYTVKRRLVYKYHDTGAITTNREQIYAIYFLGKRTKKENIIIEEEEEVIIEEEEIVYM